MRLAVRAILLLTMHTKKLQQPETVKELIELFVKDEPMFLDEKYGKIWVIDRVGREHPNAFDPKEITWSIVLDNEHDKENYPEFFEIIDLNE